MMIKSNPGPTKILRPVTAIPIKTTGSASNMSVTISRSRDIGAKRYEFTLVPFLAANPWQTGRSSRDASQGCFAARHQIVRSHLDLESAAAGAHIDARQRGHGRVDVRVQPAPLPKRADASDDISRGALRLLRRGHLGPLGVGQRRQCLQIELGADWNER